VSRRASDQAVSRNDRSAKGQTKHFKSIEIIFLIFCPPDARVKKINWLLTRARRGYYDEIGCEHKIWTRKIK
jgi:hypothetical protein